MKEDYRKSTCKKLEKALAEIKETQQELYEKVLSIKNDYEKLQDEEKLKLLVEFASVIDYYYKNIAEVCDLYNYLETKQEIYFYYLVKTLFEEKTKYYHILNEKLVALGRDELHCYQIEYCEKIMANFLDKCNKEKTTRKTGKKIGFFKKITKYLNIELFKSLKNDWYSGIFFYSALIVLSILLFLLVLCVLPCFLINMILKVFSRK
tara:strand:+ start:1586 stop:2206 length:621 start_codon:yes stop_codon:yes gene_type:complete